MVTNVESGVKLIIVFVTQSDKHRNYVDNRYRGVLNHFVNPRLDYKKSHDGIIYP